jgi:mono/diheme cytochrome c family protein
MKTCTVSPLAILGRRFLRAMLLPLCSAVLVATNVSADEPTIHYNRDIRPILAENCFACHGPDSASRKADLRMDKRDAAIASMAILPGNLSESSMIERITSTDPESIMPPPSSHKQLKPEQIDLLKRWVASGAEYMPHWSFIPPAKPALPTVKNSSWVRNPIDQFVLAELEERGLSPAPQADKRTLARRLSLDLTGLPPAPELVEAFVADESPEAYSKLVDTLMNSKAWGEHRGRYWLDAARYADSHGIHFDNYREMWSYRDWVISAFNRNLPFDQFTIEQLAGDMLPEKTLDQQIASGFNRCNITTSEGGAIDEEYLVLYNRDRTETTAQVWMGLTAGCSVCHDHKFDPISQKEFYELAAFFNNTTQAAMDGNIKDTPPVIQVPQVEDRPRFAQIPAELASVRKAVDARKETARPEFATWLDGDLAAKVTSAVPSRGLVTYGKLNEGEGTQVAFQISGNDRKVDVPGSISWQPGQVSGNACVVDKPGAIALDDVGNFERDQAFTFGAWVKLAGNVGGASVFARMDEDQSYRGWDLWIEGGLRPAIHLVSDWPGNALKVASNNAIKADTWTHVLVSYDGSSKATGVKIYLNGEPQPTSVQADTLNGSIKTNVPWKLGQRNKGQGISGFGIQDFRIYDRSLGGDEAKALAQSSQFATLASKPKDQWTDAEKEGLYQWWLPAFDQQTIDARKREADLVKEENDIKGRGTIAHVMNEKQDMPSAFILFRGEYDRRKDPVQASTPAILPAFPADSPKNRLGLAKWLLQADQPLTSRVTVNRFWQEIFGQGLVRTAGDFGITGELPANQELLDWLAVEFREQNWDMKKFYKMMVMSSTYRQAAITTPEKQEKDPENRLLSRGPRFRMDAEMVRDYALSASGLLSPKIGGPSVKPYMPEGVWEAVAMIGSNTRDYRPDSGESLYRRSMYTFWKRSAPPASMEIFNAPNRETCAVRRERTNTPLQALVTLNDPQFVEAARNLAQKAIQSDASEDSRIDFIAKRLLSRSFDADESKIVRDSLAALRSDFEGRADDAKQLVAFGESKAAETVDVRELAAWTMLVNELMNLDEVLNK